VRLYKGKLEGALVRTRPRPSSSNRNISYEGSWPAGARIAEPPVFRLPP
jgi:hypothetical protein